MDQKKSNIIALAVITVLAVGSVWLFWPPAEKITQGLDIKGGLSVILTAQPLASSRSPRTPIQRVEDILVERVNGFGVSEASVQRQGTDAFLCSFPASRTPGGAQAPRRAGQARVRRVREHHRFRHGRSYRAADRGRALQEPRPTLPALDEDGYKPFMTGEVITSATGDHRRVRQSGGQRHDERRRRRRVGEVTTRLAPTQSRSSSCSTARRSRRRGSTDADPLGRHEISGTFTVDEAKDLAAVLESGALPVEIVDRRVARGRSHARPGLAAAGSDRRSHRPRVRRDLPGDLLPGPRRALVGRARPVRRHLPRHSRGALGRGSSRCRFRASPASSSRSVSPPTPRSSSSSGSRRRSRRARRSAAPPSRASRHAIATSIDADVVTLVSALVHLPVAIGPVRGFAFTLMLGIFIDLVVARSSRGPWCVMLAERRDAEAPGLFGLKGVMHVARRSHRLHGQAQDPLRVSRRAAWSSRIAALV